jgi:hypothetical protein
MRKKLVGNDAGLILQLVVTGQHPEWMDVTDQSLNYKTSWPQWNFVGKDEVLKHHWE